MASTTLITTMNADPAITTAAPVLMASVENVQRNAVVIRTVHPDIRTVTSAPVVDASRDLLIIPMDIVYVRIPTIAVKITAWYVGVLVTAKNAFQENMDIFAQRTVLATVLNVMPLVNVRNVLLGCTDNSVLRCVGQSVLSA